MAVTEDQVTQLLQQMQRIADQLETTAASAAAGEGFSGGRLSGPDLARDVELRDKRLKLEAKFAETEEEHFQIARRGIQNRINDLEKELRGLTDNEAKYGEVVDTIRELEKEQKNLAEAQNKLNRQITQGKGAAQQLQDSLLGVGSNLTALGKIFPTSKRGLTEFGKEMTKAAVSGELLIGVFLKIASNSLDFALSLDKSTASFKRATGAGNEFNSVIESAGMKYLAYGVNAEDAAKATTDLFTGFRDFTTLADAERESLIATTALMEKFGVSGQTSSQILNQATKSLGMNVGEAEQMLLNITPLAAAVGKPVSEIASDLASAAPKLAFYGAGMIDVFKQLEAQSKATGLSVDELLGLVGEKFDTFEGAGMAVGKLNALLGGPYLNSIDMLNASEAERLEMIQQSMAASGVVFDDLNKFEQKAFASAIGTDVDTLRKSLNDLDPAQQLINMQQEELAKKAGDARDIMTKLKESINALVISLKPAIEKLSGWMNSISKWITENQGMAKWIAGVGLLGGLLLKFVFGRGPQRAAKAQARAVQQLAAAYGQLAAAQTTANVTAPKGGGPGLGGPGPGGMGGPMRGGRFGGALGGKGAMMRGGALAVGGLAAGYATSKGVEYFQKEGKTGAAQATSALGGAATGALTGAAIGSVIPVIGTGVGALVGGAIGLAAGTQSATKMQPVQDGIVTRNASGDVKVTPIDNKDNIIATKKGGALAKMGLVGGMGMMGPMGMLAAGGGLMIQRAIVQPIVEAITSSGNVNVVVKIGEKELNKQIVAALNSHQGKQAVSPFYQG